MDYRKEERPEFINRAFTHLNPKIYVYMQGHSEFGMTGNAFLKSWDVSTRLKEISVPTLMIGGKYDTMDPKYMGGCRSRCDTAEV